MKEIKDIIINLRKVAYEVYDWKKEDYIEHVKKIPIVKIKDKDFYNIYNSIIKIDKEFLNCIKDKTEVYLRRMVKVIKYACIFYTDEIAIAAEFDDNGLLLGKSRLLFDEEDELISKFYDEKELKIDYKIIKTYKINNNLTRNEQRNSYLIKEYLKSIKDNSLLRYLYFECFDEDIKDKNIILKKINERIDEGDINIYYKIFNLIKVLKS